MRIAVYTLTRDRLEYTKHCFASLQAKAGVDFDHFVLDNGSQDGTPDWVVRYYHPYWHHMLDNNVGISQGANLVLNAILSHPQNYDLIVKMDNDCECISDNLLGQMVEIFSDVEKHNLGPRFVLSPRVEGIVNQPKRVRYTMLAGRRIGLTSTIGGLFHVVPCAVYASYRYPLELPLAWGQDDHFCQWVRQHGAEVGYVEGLVVNHYETTHGQAARYPEYFERKWKEEKTTL